MRLPGPLIAVIGAALLAACTLGAPSDAARTSDAVRADLAARLDTVRADQQAALGLWDRVIFGEAVSCQDAIPTPEPVALPAADLSAMPDANAIQAALNAATGHVQAAAALWDLECDDPRGAIPLEMARSGRAAAQAARDPLDEASARLAAWPVGGEPDNGVQ